METVTATPTAADPVSQREALFHQHTHIARIAAARAVHRYTATHVRRLERSVYQRCRAILLQLRRRLETGD